MNGEPSAHLPSSLRRQFPDSQHRVRRVETSRARHGAISVLLGSYLLLFVSDRLWDTPHWIRMLILSSGLGMTISWVVWQLKYRRFAPENENNLPQSSKHRELPNGNQILEAVGTGPPRKVAVAVPLLLTLPIALLIVLPEASRSTFIRWLLPMSREPRFTLVRIEDLPGNLMIAQGEPFELSFNVEYRSLWRPETVTASFPGESSREATVTNGRAHFEFSGQTETRTLTLNAGDYSLRLKVTPLPRPELTEVAALISLPTYLQRPPIAKPLQNGKLHVLEGSRVVLKGLASRSLRRAWLNGLTRLSVAGSMVLSEEFEVSNDEGVTLTWEDWHGLQTQNPMKITIVAQADQVPEINVRNLSKAVAIQKDELLNLEISAVDDFGVKDIGLLFETYPIGSAKSVAHRKRTLIVKNGCPENDSLSAIFSFSPSKLDIPPDTLVKLRATARDFRPDRKASVSQEYWILVLGEVDVDEVAPPPREVAKLEVKSTKANDGNSR